MEDPLQDFHLSIASLIENFSGYAIGTNNQQLAAL